MTRKQWWEDRRWDSQTRLVEALRTLGKLIGKMSTGCTLAVAQSHKPSFCPCKCRFRRTRASANVNLMDIYTVQNMHIEYI